MLQKLCEKKIDPILIPFYSATVIPIALGTLLLGGGGHSSPMLFIPFVFLLGPLLYFFGILNTLDVNIFVFKSGLFFFLASYIQYTAYGFIFYFFSKKRTLACRNFTIWLIAIHLFSTFGWFILFLSTGRKFW